MPLLWIFENDLSCSNTAQSEWKHPAKCSIWKCTVYKAIVSQKRDSTLKHWNKSFLKRIPRSFIFTSTWNINIISASTQGCVFYVYVRFDLNENSTSLHLGGYRRAYNACVRAESQKWRYGDEERQIETNCWKKVVLFSLHTKSILVAS